MPNSKKTIELDREANEIMRDAGDKVYKGKLDRVKGQPQKGNPVEVQVGKKKGPKATPFDLKSVADVLIDHGYNPTEEILRVMPELDAVTRAKLSATLLEYIEPKKRAIEHTGKVEHTVTIEELIKNAK